MERFVVALPLPAGAEDDVRAFVGEVEARIDELRASRTRLGVTRETAWLQRTPMGDIFILDLEGDDPVGSNEGFAASSDPFDVWFKERAGAIFDANFNEPIPVRPEKLYRSTRTTAAPPRRWPSPRRSCPARRTRTARWPTR